MTIKKNPDAHEISIDRNGKTFTGHYQVRSDLITVTYLFYSKTRQLGSMGVETLAAALLWEILNGITDKPIVPR